MKKIYSIISTLLIFITTAQVVAPTLYNASEVKEIYVDSAKLSNKYKQEFLKEDRNDLSHEDTPVQTQKEYKKLLNKLSCSLVHKQLNKEQYHPQTIQKYHNYNKSRTINVGAICSIKLLKIASSPEVTNVLYEIPNIESNLILRCMHENIVFTDIVKNKFSKFNSINITKYSRPRDGPTAIGFKLNQGRRLGNEK